MSGPRTDLTGTVSKQKTNTRTHRKAGVTWVWLSDSGAGAPPEAQGVYCQLTWQEGKGRQGSLLHTAEQRGGRGIIYKRTRRQVTVYR